MDKQPEQKVISALTANFNQYQNNVNQNFIEF